MDYNWQRNHVSWSENIIELYVRRLKTILFFLRLFSLWTVLFWMAVLVFLRWLSIVPFMVLSHNLRLHCSVAYYQQQTWKCLPSLASILKKKLSRGPFYFTQEKKQGKLEKKIMCSRFFLNHYKEMEISLKMEKFHSTVCFTISHIHSAIAVEWFLALKK